MSTPYSATCRFACRTMGSLRSRGRLDELETDTMFNLRTSWAFLHRFGRPHWPAGGRPSSPRGGDASRRVARGRPPESSTPRSRPVPSERMASTRSRPVNREPRCRCSGRWSDATPKWSCLPRTLADPRAHGFVRCTGRPVSARRGLADVVFGRAPSGSPGGHARTAGRDARGAPRSARWRLCCRRDSTDDRCDLVAVLDAVAANFREQQTGGPLVLFVDDIHWVDTTSATLLAQLVDADLVFLVSHGAIR